MRRREFITFVGAAATWPLAAHAQQTDAVRLIGMLMPYSESDPFGRSLVATFRAGLGKLGWMEGSNLHIELRWAAGDVNRMSTFAKELIDLQPDAILAASTPVTGAIARQTRTIPMIIALAAHYKVPAVYETRPAAEAGGLISYGSDFAEQFREAAGYIDRILKHTKPEDLPIQEPAKFELVINLETAKALGLAVPLTMQMTADEVIE
jgi:putative ABC transport system substrate-binding protein